MSGYAHSGMSREDYEAREQLRSVAALIEERWPSEYQILQTELEMLVERIEKGPRASQSDPEPEGPRCVKCRHPKRDHDGRPDHLTNHSPLVAGDPWCHACDAECHYEDPGEYTGIKRSCFFRDRATHRVRRVDLQNKKTACGHWVWDKASKWLPRGTKITCKECMEAIPGG